jgi:hypothetical protein
MTLECRYIVMLEYSQGREGPSLQLLVNHDDAQREFAYQEKDNAPLNVAKAHGSVPSSASDPKPGNEKQ